MNKEIIIETLREFLFRKDEIEFAYLFGSFLKTESYHDIDIAVFIGNSFLAEETQKFPYGYESFITGSISGLLKTENIDIVLLNKAPLLITQRIIHQGRLLFEKNKLNRISFENNNRKQFIDTENFRKIKSFYLKKRINNYA